MGMNPRLLRPTASGFDPRRIAGIDAWWDFSDLSTLTIDTGISAVADKSGNGYNATQSVGGNQPLSSQNQRNGRAVADFDGTGDRLQTANVSADLAAFSSFVALSPRTLGQLSFGRIWTRNDIQRAMLVASGNQFTVAHGNRQAAGTTTSISLNDWFYITGTSSGGSSPNFELWVNGQSQAINASGTANTSSVASNPYAIGDRAAGARAFDGRIGEIIIYNRVLSAAEITKIEQYLAKKWGF
jgi:hypothetical protein